MKLENILLQVWEGLHWHLDGYWPHVDTRDGPHGLCLFFADGSESEAPHTQDH